MSTSINGKTRKAQRALAQVKGDSVLRDTRDTLQMNAYSPTGLVADNGEFRDHPRIHTKCTTLLRCFCVAALRMLTIADGMVAYVHIH